MSYLDVPRLHVGGTFYTDPSTVDNDPTHYIPNNGPPSPWQMPSGKHHFQFQNCYVRSAIGQNGQPVQGDPVIGAAFASTDIYVTQPAPPTPTVSPAKLVDLDVYQQAVSTIFGLQVSITVGTTTIIGDVFPSPVLNSTWFGRVLPTRAWDDPGGTSGYGDDSNATGTFQTQIRIPLANWQITTSPLLTALKAATYADENYIYLSFKFVLDSYINVFFGSAEPNWATGRFVGTIGAVSGVDEAVQTPAARWLNPPPAPTKESAWFIPMFYGAPFKVDETRQVLVLDLANSLSMQAVGGSPVDLGVLTAMVTPLDGPEVVLGEVNYNSFQYTTYAGIVELPLNSEQVTLLSKAPLTLRTSRTDIGDPNLFTESSNGIWWCVDQRSFRMSPEPALLNTTLAIVYATLWGKPYPGFQLGVQVVSVHGDTPGATVAPTNPGDTPQADGALTATIGATTENGIATVSLNLIRDPGQRTPWLDSQLYFVDVYSGTPWPGQVQEQQISVLGWAAYPVNETPAWADVSAMMERYDALFPAMKEQITLTDQHSFSIFAWNPPWFTYGYDQSYSVPPGLSAGAIGLYMSRAIDDPRFMPLTRDLSPNKIMTVLYWILNNPPSTAAGDQQESSS